MCNRFHNLMAFANKRAGAALAVAAVACCFGAASRSQAQQPLTERTPATPLVVHNPYFSLWSFNDALNEGNTRHWTGAPQGMVGAIRVDGKSWNFMGNGGGLDPAPQLSRTIWPTHVIYEFAVSGVQLTATFFTPALPQDLDVLSRPLTYLSWSVKSTDGKPHSVQLYIAASARIAANDEHEPMVWGTSRVGDMTVLRVGTSSQDVLAKAGDNLRIDWGWLNIAVPRQSGMEVATIGEGELNDSIQNGNLPTNDDLDMPRPSRVDQPMLAVRFDLGDVSASPVDRHLMLAYDDRQAIEFFHQRLTDYWRRNRMTMAQMLLAAEREEEPLDAKAKKFDQDLFTDLVKTGGDDYAHLAILAYQQTLGAHVLVSDINGNPLLFSKEDFSNGCINTVDVTYPSAPFFLLFNPKLIEALLQPIMEYSSMPRWPWPFAPHDLGTYPLANGQVYGGAETSEIDQMPVEETGNMLILINALAHAEGNAHYASQYWPLLTKWAEYLREKGLAPENQLSTDDFAGHLAHNANLSIKAILALGSYAQLADQLGKHDEAEKYRHTAQQMATQWMTMAADGDHTKLAFNMNGTWSQKYNLVWDKVLGLHLFPPSLAENEVHFYLQHQNAFGLPLDYRHTYTKLDWTVWTATLADNQQDFAAFLQPLHKFVTQSPSRVPLSDWFDTVSSAQVGFQARSVVGGIYMKVLADPALWHKWTTQQ